jgi:hypothetical protein
MLDATFPPCRIFATSQPPHSGSIEYLLDPTTGSVGSFGLDVPNRLQHPQHMLQGDFLD